MMHVYMYKIKANITILFNIQFTNLLLLLLLPFIIIIIMYGDKIIVYYNTHRQIKVCMQNSWRYFLDQCIFSTYC